MSAPNPPKTLSPAKLAHVVLNTPQLARMTKFYELFLGARITYSNDFISFLTTDEEHHRIALISTPQIKPKDHDAAGLEHVAFTFDSLKDLCTAYRQRKAWGGEPGFCVNHGVTTSMYYQDPDGNQIEVQVDNFDNAEEATAHMYSPMFQKNPFGARFDPEELSEAVERGVDERELKKPRDVGPTGSEVKIEIDALMRAAPVGV